jgi:hypothetical protein
MNQGRRTHRGSPGTAKMMTRAMTGIVMLIASLRVTVSVSAVRSGVVRVGLRPLSQSWFVQGPSAHTGASDRCGKALVNLVP